MKCPDCGGKGGDTYDVFGWTKCRTCNGTGEIEQTNDEWRKTCSAEEFAEWVSDIVYDCADMGSDEDGKQCYVCPLHWCSKQDVLEWLKQPHSDKE